MMFVANHQMLALISADCGLDVGPRNILEKIDWVADLQFVVHLMVGAAVEHVECSLAEIGGEREPSTVP